MTDEPDNRKIRAPKREKSLVFSNRDPDKKRFFAIASSRLEWQLLPWHEIARYKDPITNILYHTITESLSLLITNTYDD